MKLFSSMMRRGLTHPRRTRTTTHNICPGCGAYNFRPRFQGRACWVPSRRWRNGGRPPFLPSCLPWERSAFAPVCSTSSARTTRQAPRRRMRPVTCPATGHGVVRECHPQRGRVRRGGRIRPCSCVVSLHSYVRGVSGGQRRQLACERLGGHQSLQFVSVL